ncbi:hypothetical protein [Propionivibrio sp.]|uniref:hypothetical protein n=1 Tax=Propionivibrio sp. TaxID=2212460 RepID=UPI0025ED0C15|nr:hypothetical protein [Propionivibrio sp.]MBK7356175.1 hypothetical protein [Propionivibrio sp.]
MRQLTIRLALGCLLLVAFSALAGEEAENILADDSRATAELEKQIAVPPPAPIPRRNCASSCINVAKPIGGLAATSSRWPTFDRHLA